MLRQHVHDALTVYEQGLRGQADTDIANTDIANLCQQESRATGIRDLTARKTPALPTVIWVIVLLLGNLITIPVYWWIYLRLRPPRQVAVGGESRVVGA